MYTNKYSYNVKSYFRFFLTTLFGDGLSQKTISSYCPFKFVKNLQINLLKCAAWTCRIRMSGGWMSSIRGVRRASSPPSSSSVHAASSTGRGSSFLSVLRIRELELGAFLTLDPGSGIGFFRIPDPKPIFLRAFWVLSSTILWKLAQIFFKI